MKPKLETWTPLSSFEVYEVISSSEYDLVDKQSETSTLAFFKSSLKWYLETFHSVNSVPQENFFSLAEALHTNYDLSQHEVMQIIDLLPKKQVELHCIVPNCEKRFSEQEIFQILKLVSETLVKPEEEPHQSEML
ncbi:hypothetical protein OJ253_53 [Cryptosporidium canis]|uniref:DNA-directed RNA polymerase III subunit RPC9 n=1 Tax=Cryptosporidium canis TaxID=195482 RepID=A0A9D5DLV3_9CRYT|nr:hypothetical protein OJ253_53 [Cryptosporidium canis]